MLLHFIQTYSQYALEIAIAGAIIKNENNYWLQ